MYEERQLQNFLKPERVKPIPRRVFSNALRVY